MYKYLKRTNALDTYLTQGINNNATIFFSIEREIKIQQIGTWHKNFNEVVNYLNSFITNSDCAKHGLVNLGKNFCIIRNEPLRWWIMGDSDKIISSLNTENAVNLDISHSWVKLNISGLNAEKLLLHHIPLDLRDKKFPIFNFKSSSIHNIGVKLLKNQKGYSLFLPRSFSVSIWKQLIKTADQYQYQIN